MARVADVAAGTFYLHFRDKRQVYEKVAEQIWTEFIDTWESALPIEADLASRLIEGLNTALSIWLTDLQRTRLIVEGPAIGAHAHASARKQIAEFLTRAPDARALAVGRMARINGYALLLMGLIIELGRLACFDPDSRRIDEAAAELRLVLRLAAEAEAVEGKTRKARGDVKRRLRTAHTSGGSRRRERTQGDTS